MFIGVGELGVLGTQVGWFLYEINDLFPHATLGSLEIYVLLPNSIIKTKFLHQNKVDLIKSDFPSHELRS